MYNSFLRTKIVIPPQRRDDIPRHRLIDQLIRGLAPDKKVTLLSAPAGYGKTTALAQWAQTIQKPVSWYSIDRSDGEFERFFRYLVLAWENCYQAVKESAVYALLGTISPDHEDVLASFINLAYDAPDPTIFVLNDYHLIEDQVIHQSLTYVIDNLPPQCHFFLAIRGEVPLPFARYRSKGELLEIGRDELSFSEAETREFLNHSQGLNLLPVEIRLLQEKLRGWATGIRLILPSLKRNRARVEDLSIDGRQRYIADYLRDELMAHLSPDIRQFLLKTSILERLSGSLCQTVTNEDWGQKMLEQIEEEGLFLEPLDDTRHWFRYHPLFADFLSQELNRVFPEEVTTLHRRAARWYFEQDQFEAAFLHAIEGRDEDVVVQIAENQFEIMLHTGQLNLLGRWLKALPDKWSFDHPLIGLIKAQWLSMTGNLPACERMIEELEEHLTTNDEADRRFQLARVNVVRCQLACFQNDLSKARPLARNAISDLPDIDHHYRANVHHALGEAYRHIGQWQKAREHYHKVLALVDYPQFQFRATHVHGALADVELRQGQLRQALKYWDKAQAAIEQRESWGVFPMPIFGWVYIRKAEIHYEWNQLDKASELIHRGLVLAELGGVVQSMVVGYLVAGRLQLAKGEPGIAEKYLEQARPLVENAHLSYWAGFFERFQLELWLAMDKLRTAVQWSDEKLVRLGTDSGGQNELEMLAISRLLIFKGDKDALDQAIAILKSVEQKAEAEGRMAIQVEALALLAMNFGSKRDEIQAMMALEQALRLAEPEGYTRLFIDLGFPMARLLQIAATRQVLPNYAKKLLDAFGEDWIQIEKHRVPEPLTSREREILNLLASGLTNKEIASELFISPETVKKHAGNIYSKLGVGSRTEAAARAVELDLLD